MSLLLLPLGHVLNMARESRSGRRRSRKGSRSSRRRSMRSRRKGGS